MKSLFIGLALFVAVEAQAQKQSLKLWWQGPPGWQTNGMSFNVRYFAAGSTLSDWTTWPISVNVSNALKITIYNVNPTQFYAITATNALTGSEGTNNLSPIIAQYNWQGLTNMLATIEAEEYDPNEPVPH